MGPFDFLKRNKTKPSRPASADDGPWIDSDTPAGDAGDSAADTAPSDNDSGGDDFDFDID